MLGDSETEFASGAAIRKIAALRDDPDGSSLRRMGYRCFLRSIDAVKSAFGARFCPRN